MMESIQLRQVAEAAAAITVAATPKACAQLFRDAAAAFRITTFACGVVDLEVQHRSVFFAFDWPKNWQEFYFGSGVLYRDPLIDAIKRLRRPFSWSDLRVEHAVAPIGTEALRLTALNGWTEGLAVPIDSGRQHCGLVSMAGPRGPFAEDERRLLAALSFCLFARLRGLVPQHGFAVRPAGLSEREVGCLRLVARGKTDRAIARELGIAADTAHEHVESAKKKLAVSSRAEAIAVAVSLCIVAP